MAIVEIRMRVICNHHCIGFTIDYRIDAAKWEKDKQRVKLGCMNELKQSASEIDTNQHKDNNFKTYIMLIPSGGGTLRPTTTVAATKINTTFAGRVAALKWPQ